MSYNLYWRPPPSQRSEHCFAYRLKFFLSEALWGHDGSLYSDWQLIGNEWVPFLRGVAAATTNDELRKEAQKLISLIDKYGEVEIAIK